MTSTFVQTTHSFNTLLQHLRPKEVIMTYRHIDKEKISAASNTCTSSSTHAQVNIDANTISETLRK